MSWHEHHRQPRKPLSLFQRQLTLWVGLCIAGCILLVGFCKRTSHWFDRARGSELDKRRS